MNNKLFFSFRKIIFATFVISLVGIVWILIGKNQRSPETLTIGMMSGYPPFMSINNIGKAEGFDVDIAYELGKKLNKKIDLKDMSLAELFVALQKNKIDLLISGLNITQERLGKIAMIYYQGAPIKTARFLFWKSLPQGVTTLSDLKDKNATICVLPGSTEERFLSQFDYVYAQCFNNYIDMVMALKFGKATAALFEADIVDEYCKKFPELVVMEEPLGSFEILGKGIGINNKNDTLIQQVDCAIKELQRDGTIPTLEKKWITKGK